MLDPGMLSTAHTSYELCEIRRQVFKVHLFSMRLSATCAPPASESPAWLASSHLSRWLTCNPAAMASPPAQRRDDSFPCCPQQLRAQPPSMQLCPFPLCLLSLQVYLLTQQVPSQSTALQGTVMAEGRHLWCQDGSSTAAGSPAPGLCAASLPRRARCVGTGRSAPGAAPPAQPQNQWPPPAPAGVHAGPQRPEAPQAGEASCNWLCPVGVPCRSHSTAARLHQRQQDAHRPEVLPASLRGRHWLLHMCKSDMCEPSVLWVFYDRMCIQLTHVWPNASASSCSPGVRQAASLPASSQHEIHFAGPGARLRRVANSMLPLHCTWAPPFGQLYWAALAPHPGQCTAKRVTSRQSQCISTGQQEGPTCSPWSPRGLCSSTSRRSCAPLGGATGRRRCEGGCGRSAETALPAAAPGVGSAAATTCSRVATWAVPGASTHNLTGQLVSPDQEEHAACHLRAAHISSVCDLLLSWPGPELRDKPSQEWQPVPPDLFLPFSQRQDHGTQQFPLHLAEAFAKRLFRRCRQRGQHIGG